MHEYIVRCIVNELKKMCPSLWQWPRSRSRTFLLWNASPYPLAFPRGSHRSRFSCHGLVLLVLEPYGRVITHPVLFCTWLSLGPCESLCVSTSSSYIFIVLCSLYVNIPQSVIRSSADRHGLVPFGGCSAWGCCGHSWTCALPATLLLTNGFTLYV